MHETCTAEISQELVLRGKTLEESDCLRVARGKTGPLFAFCAALCSGGKLEFGGCLGRVGVSYRHRLSACRRYHRRKRRSEKKPKDAGHRSVAEKICFSGRRAKSAVKRPYRFDVRPRIGNCKAVAVIANGHPDIFRKRFFSDPFNAM